MKKDRRYYEMVGKLFINKGADTASRAAESLLNIRASEGNYGKIQEYFSRFCFNEGVLSEFTMQQRKQFIAAMLHLYNPQVYVLPVDSIFLNFGFIRSLSNVLGCDERNMGKSIRQVVFEESVYDDFREKVKSVLESFNQKAA